MSQRTNEKNNYRRLKEEADIETIVDYCGIERGKTINSAHFVICPNPAHNDTHPTNAYYRKGWNTIYCTTCQKNMSPIDVIMWSRDVSYGEAADILWELEGRPSWYYADRSSEAAETFSISLSELSFLNIKIPSSVYLPVRYTKAREFDPKVSKEKIMYKYERNGYFLVRQERTCWCDYLSKKNIRRLVVSRCNQMEAELNDIEKRLGCAGLFVDERKKISELSERAKDRRLK